jgi:hypothetical protein
MKSEISFPQSPTPTASCERLGEKSHLRIGSEWTRLAGLSNMHQDGWRGWHDPSLGLAHHVSLSVLCSWKSITIRVRSFMGMIFLVEGPMIVVFTFGGQSMI